MRPKSRGWVGVKGDISDSAALADRQQDGKLHIEGRMHFFGQIYTLSHTYKEQRIGSTDWRRGLVWEDGVRGLCLFLITHLFESIIASRDSI